MPVDLQRMRENAGGLTKRELVAALREHGFVLRREGAKHEVWSNGTTSVMLPRTPKGTGTKRQIVDQIIASRGDKMTIVQDILARPYKRVVERGEDGVYTASLVELPGAISEGDSYEEALRNLDEGLADLIGVMLEDGRPIPEPVSQQAFSGRLQIRLTPSLHARATMFAQMEGVSLNRVLSDAVASYVGFGTRQMASAGAGDSGRAARETPGVYRTAGATATDSPPARAARAKTAARKTTAKKASDASRTAGTRPAKPPSTARPRAK